MIAKSIAVQAFAVIEYHTIAYQDGIYMVF